MIRTDAQLRARFLLSDGDIVVLVADQPGETPGHNNLLEINNV